LLSARKLLLKSALLQDLSSPAGGVKGLLAERNAILRDAPGEEESFCALFFLANKNPNGSAPINLPATGSRRKYPRPRQANGCHDRGRSAPIPPLCLARLRKSGKPGERCGQLQAVGKHHQQSFIGNGYVDGRGIDPDVHSTLNW
jgi:hypothetical protein